VCGGNTRGAQDAVSVVGDREAEDHRSRDHYVSGCKVLGGSLSARTVATVAFVSHVLWIDVVDVHDSTESDTGRDGVQLGLPPSSRYRLTPSFRTHVGLRRDVEVNRLDLVRASGYKSSSSC